MVKVEVLVPPDDTGTLVVLRDSVGTAGVTECDRDTVFEKPLMLIRVMVAVPDEPAGIVSEFGLALILKSTTLTTTVIE